MATVPSSRGGHRSAVSGWLRFPLLAEAIAAPSLVLPGAAEPLSYAEEIEGFAVAWFQAGLPVPHDYRNADAQPSDERIRAYQLVWGKGHGVALIGIVPFSLATVCDEHASAPLADPRQHLPRHILSSSLFRVGAVALFPVAMQLLPLVFAHCNGFEFWGADLSLEEVRRPTLHLAANWADSLMAGAAAVTFKVGSYLEGGSVHAAPLSLVPPPSQVVRDSAQRHRRLRTGAAFLWLIVAALRGTPIGDMAAQTVSACSAWRGPSAVPPNHGSGDFSSGVGGIHPLINRPAGLPTAPSSLDAARQRAIYEGKMLRRAHLADHGPLRDAFQAWADRISPPELADIPPDLMSNLPAFCDDRLDEVAFAPIVQPLSQPWLPRMPNQRPAPRNRCPRRAIDLMPHSIKWLVERWTNRTFADLRCIRDHGEDCERSRPRPLVVAQSQLYPWGTRIRVGFSPVTTGVWSRPRLLSAAAAHPKHRFLSPSTPGVS
jgi:hypothetical protein